MNESYTCSRRDAIGIAAALAVAPLSLIAQEQKMLTREIPGTGEALPVIGLGTYIAFDVRGSDEEMAIRRAIVALLVDKGASVIDSSPMYNRSEKVVGEIIRASAIRDRLFLATKVWTDGKSAGERQMQASLDLMNADVMDLMQVHNLRDLDTHITTILEWQESGRIRYCGITDYRASALRQLEAAMQAHKPQFIQINYSLGEREADRRVLPLARDLGVAVLINRPYHTGRLFRAVGARPLPDWASVFAQSWGQFFLKYIISHPAVTCAIPATSNPQHMLDNLGAGFGELPDEATRQRMERFFDAL